MKKIVCSVAFVAIFSGSALADEAARVLTPGTKIIRNDSVIEIRPHGKMRRWWRHQNDRSGSDVHGWKVDKRGRLCIKYFGEAVDYDGNPEWDWICGHIKIVHNADGSLTARVGVDEPKSAAIEGLPGIIKKPK